MNHLNSGHRVTVFVGVLFASVFLTIQFGGTAGATPGSAYGNEMWFQPGSTNINGTLRAYKNGSQYTSMTAGSGLSNSYTPCQLNLGRLPNGWYGSGNDHHKHDKNGAEIDGRVWGLQDKDCGSGTIRRELFIHTEETVSNGQYCPTTGDDKHCWETAAWDYRSIGCVKISYPANGFPNSIGSLNSWWDSQIGGGHGVYYSNILWVGSVAPPT